MPPAGSSPDENCIELRDPVRAQEDSDCLTYGALPQLCRRRGYARKDSKAALKTCLSTVDAADWILARNVGGGAHTSQDLPLTKEKSSPTEELRLAFISGKEVPMERGQWWEPRAKAHWNAVRHESTSLE